MAVSLTSALTMVQESLATSYSVKVGGKTATAEVEKSASGYTASVAGVASASGNSESSAEAALSMRVSVMA